MLNAQVMIENLHAEQSQGKSNLRQGTRRLSRRRRFLSLPHESSSDDAQD
jgi:hypothetical protein